MDYAELFDRDFRTHQEGKVLTNKAMERYNVAFNLIKDLHELASALDIGCANGGFTARLREIVHGEHGIVWGMDVSETAIQRAKTRFPRCHFFTGNLTDITVSDSSFDLVSCLDVIYYLDDAGRKKAVDEIARVLKSNGYLLVLISWPRFTKTRTGTSFMKPNELRHLVGNRFELIKEATTSTIRGLPFIRSGAAMLFRKR